MLQGPAIVSSGSEFVSYPAVEPGPWTDDAHLSPHGGQSDTALVYLLHFDQPYPHARHYLGWIRDLEARLADHRAGSGARLLAVIKSAGIGFSLVRTWTPAGRKRERQITNQGGLSRSCPACGVRSRAVA